MSNLQKECEGRRWIPTLESCLTFEAHWLEYDGLIEDSNDDLERFPNVVLVDSNLDEKRHMKLACWKEDFEGRLDSSEIRFLKVWDEEESGISKHAGECEIDKCLVIWVKVESWMSLWEVNPFEAQDSWSCFLKVWRESFPTKENLFEDASKIDVMKSFEVE